MARIYYDENANIDILKKKTISIIGYGNQGRSQALNMRDSGIKNIIIGSRQDESLEMALQDGFETCPIREACLRSDILFLLIPDEIAPDLFKEQIEPGLEKGNVLNFASGYNITFGFITPPEDVDVIMVAPRMIGKGVRELYQSGDGFPSFVSVHQDASGNGWNITLALAKAIGSTRKGCIEVSFNDETYLDLMAEQATWPLIYAVFTEAFKYQIEMGHPEEAVLMEMYLSKEPVVMMEKAADVGFFKQMPFHSNTSQYGQLTGFKKTDKNIIREFIAEQYKRISSGRFANEWKEEQESGLKQFETLRNSALEHEMSQAEQRVKSKLG